MKTNTHFCLHVAEFFLEWEMFQTSALEEIETHFMPNNFFLRKSCLSLVKVEKYCRVGQVTDENMAHAHSMLDT